MYTIKTVSIFLFLIFIIGCGGAGIHGNAPKTYDTVKEMTTDIKAGVQRISIDEFKTLYESDEMFLLIDIREQAEFDEGSIDGAIHIARGQLEFKIGNEQFWDSEGMFVPEKDELIIVYGEMIDRGAYAAETLNRFGYKNAKYIHGGWTAWLHGPDAIVEEEVVVEESGCGN
jgi:rhodanese-related sulfurtransferase